MFNFKNLFFFSVLTVLSCGPVMSQDSDIVKEKPQRVEITHPNIIKINTLALAFKNISLVYERGILPRLSAGIGIGYKYAGSEPKLFSVNASVIRASLDKIQGISISPELRYYLRACDPGLLDGFYGGLYFKYVSYKTAAHFEFSPGNYPVESYTADLALREYGVGIELGYQMLIKERFSIDFLFFGPRFSRYKLIYQFTEQPSRIFLDELSEYLNEVLDRFGRDYEANVKKEGEKKASTSFSFASMRFGLSLGSAF